jgi:ATP-dependent helicase HrpB
VQVPDDSHLARADWIVVGDASGAASGARVLLAAALDATSVEDMLQDQIVVSDVLAFDPATTGVTAERQRRLGAITLARQPVQKLDADALVAALLAGVEKHGLALLPWREAAQSLRDRASFGLAQGLDIADLSEEALLASLADWLAPALEGKRRLSALDDAGLAEALRHRLGWGGCQALDRFAPARLSTPAGSSHAIDYAADGGPAVDVRVQALFGLSRHPMLADGRVPLTLRLTSPAGRPIQVTRDLPGFWAGSWADVKKELKGRYPKHSWPDDPLAAQPMLRAKRPGQP